MSVESPGYEVVRRDGSLEMRRYRPYLTASVTTHAVGYNEATYAGFGLLADYIFGNNAEAGSIAMTAPVTASRPPGVKISMTAPVTSQRARDEQLETPQPSCIVAVGEPEAAQHDAPWKPGFARHNEVLIVVQERAVEHLGDADQGIDAE